MDVSMPISIEEIREYEKNPKDLEARVKLNYKEIKGIFLDQHVSLQVGLKDDGSPQNHKFDLVSHDRSTVIECKEYTWTKAGSWPSAKVAHINEALFFLSRIDAPEKMIIMTDDISAGGKSLMETIVRRNSGLMDDVQFIRYEFGVTVEKDKMVIVRKKGNVWLE